MRSRPWSQRLRREELATWALPSAVARDAGTRTFNCDVAFVIDGDADAGSLDGDGLNPVRESIWRRDPMGSTESTNRKTKRVRAANSGRTNRSWRLGSAWVPMWRGM